MNTTYVREAMLDNLKTYAIALLVAIAAFSIGWFAGEWAQSHTDKIKLQISVDKANEKAYEQIQELERKSVVITNQYLQAKNENEKLHQSVLAGYHAYSLRPCGAKSGSGSATIAAGTSNQATCQLSEQTYDDLANLAYEADGLAVKYNALVDAYANLEKQK